MMEMDPTTELKGQTVSRFKRRLPFYSASKVTFLPALFVFIDCYLPACQGHQKFGIVESENLPVMFKYHDYGQEATYVPYKVQINRPLRVPLTGDTMVNGIKWRFDPTSLLITIQCLFDCLLACLKFRSLTSTICFECLFCHTSGVGLGLEKFLRTVIYHIIPFGRFLDKDYFRPILRYEKGMNLRLRRIFWPEKDKMFKLCCILTPFGLKEDIYYGIPGQVDLNYKTPPAYGMYLNPDLTFLKHINLISTINASLFCQCNSTIAIPLNVYIYLIRWHSRSGTLSMTPSTWNNSGYFDPLWSWSLFGPDACESTFCESSISQPFPAVCKVCKSVTSIRNFTIPTTTWLLMADIPYELRKTSVDVFLSISTFVINDVIFDLNFIVLYNTENGAFTSLHFFDNSWFYFDDRVGGILKRCNPSKVKYAHRLNLRAFFVRRTKTNPHSCLETAVKSV